MSRIAKYLAGLNTARLVLWCYAIWYVVNVSAHFDGRPRLWITSSGLSAIIGFALILSTRTSSRGVMQLDRWQVFRLFLMPFCVSSFAALVKDKGYVLIFPQDWRLNAIGFGAIVLFIMLVRMLNRRSPELMLPASDAKKV